MRTITILRAPGAVGVRRYGTGMSISAVGLLIARTVGDVPGAAVWSEGQTTWGQTVPAGAQEDVAEAFRQLGFGVRLVDAPEPRYPHQPSF